ncbi:hypothetical protein C8256_02390 [Kluyvera genomosp. 2]|uniref:Uncharacterized protein n=1 Tax=Kluyvera genomosp. 2 TaxID=2774054 RepID=A0A2T2Y652_9ENTR|nr:hypothetical protein C8256_02390 [Kluyvera genomosp. 2]
MPTRVASAFCPAAVWESFESDNAHVYPAVSGLVRAHHMLFWCGERVMRKNDFRRLIRTILYLHDELRHYLAGSNYGSDTPED